MATRMLALGTNKLSPLALIVTSLYATPNWEGASARYQKLEVDP